MDLTVLIENLVYQKGLVAEHGLSFYIEEDGKKILFDTGQGGNFIINANKLGIDLSEIEFLIISHGHYDHIGGLHAFLKVNRKAKIILKKQALYPKYKNNEFIGIKDIGLIPRERLELAESVYPLTKHLFILPDIKCYFEIDTHKDGFFTQSGNEIQPDNFDDELFLCHKNNDQLTILSSCSHNGITNIIETAKNYFQAKLSNVIGGFHTREATKPEMQHITDYFNNIGLKQLGVCHCTGIDNYYQLKTSCSTITTYLSTGSRLTII